MKLTENFSLSELTKSQTAERKGIDNTPSTEHQENLKRLCESILQRVRDHFGRVVSVSSGYRSEELCLAIGSKTTSQHAKGEAADFEIFDDGIEGRAHSVVIAGATQAPASVEHGVGEFDIPLQHGALRRMKG